MEEKKSIWNRKGVLLATACFCCALWGSAFPCIKVGYRIFSIAQGDAASQLLFAGLRFFLAGILALAFGSLLQRKWLLPHKSTIGPIAALATFQTVGQYIFFYIRMAHAVATRGSGYRGFFGFGFDKGDRSEDGCKNCVGIWGRSIEYAPASRSRQPKPYQKTRPALPKL